MRIFMNGRDDTFSKILLFAPC